MSIDVPRFAPALPCVTALFLGIIGLGCSGAVDQAPSAAASAPPAEATLPPGPGMPAPPPAPRRYRELAIGFDAVCGVLEGGVVRCHGEGASFDVDAGGSARAVAFGHHRRHMTLYVLREDGVVLQGAAFRRGTTLTPIEGLTHGAAIAPSGGGVCVLVAGAVRCWDPDAPFQVVEVRLPAPAVTLFGDLTSGCSLAWGDGLSCDTARGIVTCAQLEDSRAFCWPQGDRRARETPALAGAKSVVIHHGLRVWVDAAGGVFRDTVTGRTRPSALAAPPGAVQAVGSAWGACFRDAQGRVACSGRLVPGFPAEGVPDATLTSIREIEHATTLLDAFSTTCALSAGEAWCWGDNRGGRLGVPAPDSSHPATPIAGVADATALFAADKTVCVRRGASGLSCWGSALAGLGEGSWPTPTPLSIAGATGLAGDTHAGVVVTSSRALFGFGELSPRYYQTTEAAPAVVEDEDAHTWNVGDVGRDPTAAELAGVAGRVVEVAATRQLACVRTEDRALVCFHKTEGRIEGGVVPVLSDATRVIETGVTQVATLGDAVCARDGTGMRCFHVIRYVDANGPALGVVRIEPTPWPFDEPADAWGGDGRWQCGLFGARVRCVHEGREERTLDGVTAFDAASSGAVGVSLLCGITADRRVICTSLGGAARPNESVAGLTDVVGIALGEGFGCARRANGTVSCWGRNRAGVLPTAGDREVFAVPSRLDAGPASAP